MPALEVRGLRVRYGKAVAVDGVDLTIERGELLAMVGPNGAGKTSFLRALSRLIPSEGDVLLGDAPLPLAPTAVVRAGLIQCPERRRLFPGLSVADNLALGALRRRDADVASDRAWIVELFPRLGERLDQAAGTMSGGEQQQLAIARALMARPDVLLMDEPSLGLASIVKEAIVASVLSLKERGITTLLVEQDVTFAFRCADRVVVLENGRITKRGTTAEIEADPSVRAAYLGVT
ncbi:MAG TPA: ABC transporter ATP-binding protein [Actinomycetota bacterium]